MEAEEPPREYVLTVGNIERSQATLVDLDYNVLELPKYLLPLDIVPGSVVRLSIRHEVKEEERRQQQVSKIQKEMCFRELVPVNKVLE